jgi:hypothetical protein
LPKESLSKTNWNDFKEPIAGTLIPNFFITYFAQDLPHCNISDNKIKAKFIRLGTGYEPWANTVNDAVKKLDDIFSVMEEIKTLESLPLATSNGPFGALECLTAAWKALSHANPKGTGTNDWVIRSLDD